MLRQTIQYDLAITESFYYLYPAYTRGLAYGPVIYTQHIPGSSISFWNSPAADRPSPDSRYEMRRSRMRQCRRENTLLI
jgi:hypothetical protein